MSKRKARGYQNYGSTKGAWKIFLRFILAVVGGSWGTTVLEDLIAQQGGLAAMALFIVAGLLSAAMLQVCMRKDWFSGLTVCGLSCMMMLYGLNKTARLDILSAATLLKDGTHLLLLLGSVVLSAAVGIWLLVIFSGPANQPQWLPVIIITVLMIFPSVSNSVNAINVAADRAVTGMAVAKAAHAGTEDRFLSGGKFTSTYEHIYYVTVAENDLIAEETKLKVSKELYSRLRPGDQVKIILHPGALGMPWIEAALTD